MTANAIDTRPDWGQWVSQTQEALVLGADQAGANHGARWLAVRRAALVAAAQAIQARDWAAKRAALAVAAQAAPHADLMVGAVFGTPEVPAAYDAYAQAGAAVTAAQATAAMAAIKADDEASKATREAARRTAQAAARRRWDAQQAPKIAAALVQQQEAAAARESAAAAAKAQAAAEAQADREAGEAAIDAMITAQVGEWVDCDGVVMTDAGEYTRRALSASDLTVIGRMLRLAAVKGAVARADEITRLAGLFRPVALLK